MTKTALVFGGTGLIGRHLLNQLIEDDSWDQIIAVTRRSLNTGSEKVIEVIADPSTIEDVADQLVADTVFCCLGTTQKSAGGRENFRKIDHDYILRCAEITRQNGANTFMLVSSIGAKVGSQSYYAHVKGETERDLANVGFETLDILQPSLLLGNRAERRLKEEIGGVVLPIFSVLLAGPLRRLRPILGEQVAKAMAAIAKTARSGTNVYTYDALVKH